MLCRLLSGAYAAFNLEATYGFGEHGTSFALRNDFTVKSHVATYWNKSKGEWRKPGFKEAMLQTLRESLSVTDAQHATLLAELRDGINE